MLDHLVCPGKSAGLPEHLSWVLKFARLWLAEHEGCNGRRGCAGKRDVTRCLERVRLVR